MRYLVRTAVIALAACSDPSGPVEIVTTPQQALRIDNRTAAPIYYFAVELNAAALINWAPCRDPGTCDGIQPGHSRQVPFSEIGFYSPSAQDALVYWWHLIPAGGGTFVPDTLRVVQVALGPGVQ